MGTGRAYYRFIWLGKHKVHQVIPNNATVFLPRRWNQRCRHSGSMVDFAGSPRGVLPCETYAVQPYLHLVPR
jgi:hypothetical protein